MHNYLKLVKIRSTITSEFHDKLPQEEPQVHQSRIKARWFYCNTKNPLIREKISLLSIDKERSFLLCKRSMVRTRLLQWVFTLDDFKEGFCWINGLETTLLHKAMRNGLDQWLGQGFKAFPRPLGVCSLAARGLYRQSGDLVACDCSR